MIGLGDRLRAARKAKGLRQEDVAKALGVHRTSCTKYENDAAEPCLQDVVKLASLFDVSVNYLLGLE